jgi:ribosomal protein S18 acetylase RimI-like enzyme
MLRIGSQVDDLAAIAHLLQAVFTQTYAHVIPPQTLARYLAQEFSSAALALKLADPNTVNLVAEADGKPIAFSRLEPNQPNQPNSAEIAKFYVDADFQGRGVAAALLSETITAAQQRDWATLWLCVWEKNPRAIAFYRKHGFVQVGHAEVLVEDVVFHDFIMSRMLTTPDP